MKLSKKLLSALLALVLAFTLVLPVLAQENETEEPDSLIPVITTQPAQSITTRTDQSFWVDIKAKIPALETAMASQIKNGDLGIQWYVIPSEGADAAPVESSSEDARVFRGQGSDFRSGAQIFAIAYNKSTSTSSEGPHRAQSETTTLTVREPTFWEVISDNVISFTTLPLMAVLLSTYGGLLVIPMAIVAAPFVAVLAVAGFFVGLFRWIF